MERSNWLISSLEPDVRESLAKSLREVDLGRGEVLQMEGEEVEYVYFPEGSTIGLFSNLASGDTIQTAMVGWDGALGAFEACGSRRANYRAEVKVAGRAQRLPARDYQRAFERSSTLRERVHKYIELLLVEARQSVACNATHTAEARLSRFFLEALDRSGGGEKLRITQEQLSQVLGVQRTTVTAVLNQMQSAGAVRCGHGTVEVVHRQALERRACGCWQIVAQARREIFGSEEPVCTT